MATTQNAEAIKTGVQFASEVVLPGGANLVNGDFLIGGIHAALGLAAKAMFGLPGLLIVSANSFARASTGHNLMENVSTAKIDARPADPVVPAPPTH